MIAAAGFAVLFAATLTYSLCRTAKEADNREPPPPKLPRVWWISRQ